MEGLCLALADWSGEIRLIKKELHPKKPAAARAGRA